MSGPEPVLVPHELVGRDFEALEATEPWSFVEEWWRQRVPDGDDCVGERAEYGIT